MNDFERKNPRFSACGLNCGLCPRFHTNGDSRCPGCLGADFYTKHPKCGVLSCCLKHDLEYCYLCHEYPCKKYENADKSDSFITHKNQMKDLEQAKHIGILAYEEMLDEKVDVLTTLLTDYNDGRRKNFYCIAINLLSLPDIKDVMTHVNQNTAPQEIVELFKAKASKKKIELVLRKKKH